MVKLKKGKRAYNPSSTLGIMRFFDAESKAPAIKPEFVLIASVLFALIILFIGMM